MTSAPPALSPAKTIWAGGTLAGRGEDGRGEDGRGEVSVGGGECWRYRRGGHLGNMKEVFVSAGAIFDACRERVLWGAAVIDCEHPCTL
jgi:hypothetical protein